jgi:hypothetical protein
MKTSPFVRASIGVAVGVACVGVVVACSHSGDESASSSSSMQTIARAADAGDAACPATNEQIECGRTCAGDGPVRPLLEQLIECQGCGGITRDAFCLNSFLDVCEPLGDPCIDFVNCITDVCGQ